MMVSWISWVSSSSSSLPQKAVFKSCVLPQSLLKMAATSFINSSIVKSSSNTFWVSVLENSEICSLLSPAVSGPLSMTSVLSTLSSWSLWLLLHVSPSLYFPAPLAHLLYVRLQVFLLTLWKPTYLYPFPAVCLYRKLHSVERGPLFADAHFYALWLSPTFAYFRGPQPQLHQCHDPLHIFSHCACHFYCRSWWCPNDCVYGLFRSREKRNWRTNLF